MTNIRRLDTTGAMPLPLDDTSVDVVLLYDVLHLVGSQAAGEKANHSTAPERRGLLKEVHRVLKPAGLVSAHCPHLATHTDVGSEDDIIEEFTAEGFVLEGNFRAKLRHSGNIVKGHILNFVRPGDRGRGAC